MDVAAPQENDLFNVGGKRGYIDVRVNRVEAAGRCFNDDVCCRRRKIDVFTNATLHPVGARMTFEYIVAAPADQRIRLVRTDDPVITACTIERQAVGGIVAKNIVVAAVAGASSGGTVDNQLLEVCRKNRVGLSVDRIVALTGGFDDDVRRVIHEIGVVATIFL